jgi:HPt (histidine-containing phosphotransfer) domain-containing protein
MNEHLAKPFELTQLVAMIQRLLGGASDADPIKTDAEDVITTAHVAVQSAVEADIANALARLGGMVPVYKRAATAFVIQLPELHPALDAAIETSNLNKALALLHTYKGTSATIGLISLSSFLDEMESMLRSKQNLEELKGQLPRLKILENFAQSEFTQAFENLTGDQVSQTPGPSLAGLDAEKLTAVLQKLQAFLVAEDYEALSYFAESRDVLMQLPEATFQRLETAIQELDFVGAMAACRAA